MSLVTLVSGGLDSTLMAVLAKEEGVDQFPLFIDYGQLARDREWEACQKVFAQLQLPKPAIMDLRGFGQLISSGLTDASLRVNEDAFLPGRNALFLLAGCAYAYQKKARAVAIGLLSERSSIFPDQTVEFINQAKALASLMMASNIDILTPLMELSKNDIIRLANQKSIEGTYSCHAGTVPPCGRCISCQEFEG